MKRSRKPRDWSEHFGTPYPVDRNRRPLNPTPTNPYDTGRPTRPADSGRPSLIEDEVNDTPDPGPDYDPMGSRPGVHDPNDTPFIEITEDDRIQPQYDPDHAPIPIPPIVNPVPPPGNPGPHARPPYQLPQTSAAKTVSVTRSVYLVRHGECDDDIDPHRHSGWRPVGLNAQGIETGEKLRDYFKNDRPLLIVSSPLRRAIETSQIIADDNNVTVTADPELGPWMIGPTLEGKLESETQGALARLQRFPQLLPDGLDHEVESWAEFIARTVRAFDRLLTNASSEYTTVLVTHSWCCLIQLNYLASRYGLRVAATGTRAHPGDIFCVDVDATGTPTALEEGEDEPVLGIEE
jgi:broad specificity phosphatase PhoE